MGPKLAGQGNVAVARSKRIGVVGINRDWSGYSTIDFGSLYQGVGLNTGNLMFTEAAHRLIEGQISTIGFSFDPTWVNQNFDCVVVPAANWLNDYSDWDWLLARLGALRVPVTVIGLGLQAATLEIGKVRVSDSSRRLVEFFAGQPGPISVRGDFTRDWLNSLGVASVVTTGCPSLYLNMFSQPEVPPGKNIVFQGTRYGLTRGFLDSVSVNRRLFQFAAEFDSPMIFQSEPEEMEVLTKGCSVSYLPRETQQLLVKLYGCSSIEVLDAFLGRNGRVFYNLSDWSLFLKECRGVLGTRLHGAILALNSGRPAVLVPHDSRTAEVASFAGIPTLFGPEVVNCKTVEEIDSLASKTSIEVFRDKRSSNQRKFVDFLRCAGLEPNSRMMF